MERFVIIAICICLVTATACAGITPAPHTDIESTLGPGGEPNRTATAGVRSNPPGPEPISPQHPPPIGPAWITPDRRPTIEPIGIPPGEVPPVIVEESPQPRRAVVYAIVGGIVLAMALYTIHTDNFHVGDMGFDL